MTEQAHKAVEYLVTFTPSGGTPVRYTDWTAPVTRFGATYASVPEMELQIPAHTGGLDDQPWRITLPLNAFSAEVARPYRSPKIAVEVIERHRTEKEDIVKVMFSGTVWKAIRNARGSKRMVAFVCRSSKVRLDQPVGLVATPECNWTFGEGPCGGDKAGNTVTPKVTQINGSVITLDSTFPTTFTRAQWFRGYVESGGVRISIRNYFDSTDQLVLTTEPPPSWLGATVTVAPGCPKTLTGCNYWGAVATFGGFGYAIPAYLPPVESV